MWRGVRGLPRVPSAKPVRGEGVGGGAPRQPLKTRFSSNLVFWRKYFHKCCILFHHLFMCVSLLKNKVIEYVNFNFYIS